VPPLPRLEVSGLSKTFGPAKVLHGVALSIAPGEIHGLVGQNGSGKSTIVKFLTGYHPADAGAELRMDGETVHQPVGRAEREAHGIAVVHQDLALLEDFSILENIRMDALAAGGAMRPIRWAHELEAARAALARVGATLDPRTGIRALSSSERATVAIARALQGVHAGGGLLIFDEPTGALGPAEVDDFYRRVDAEVEAGCSVLLVSHRLEEVLGHADRVTVLRDGRVVEGGVPTGDLSERELVRLMLGHSLHTAARSAKTAVAAAGSTPVTVTELSGERVTDLSFTIGPGEILGITGLIGAGWEEVPYLLAGARAARSGTLELDGARVELHRPALRELIGRGVGLVPEIRARDGLATELTAIDNVTIPRVSALSGRTHLQPGWQLAEADWVVEQLGLRPARHDLPVSAYSGGNQQKVLLGKWLVSQPRLLLLHEATQGVDVQAREDLFAALERAAEAGTAVLLAATDASELITVCDRILVLRDGRIAAELSGDLTIDRVVGAVFEP
jgi:ribose transport system ATP-binding protein